MTKPIVSPTIHRVNADFYQVESTSRNGRNYTVRPISGTCTCPDTVYRSNQNCKHLRAVRDLIAAATETPLEEAGRKAKTLTEPELYRLAHYYQGQAAGCACWLELAARQVAADRDAALKAVFS